jgi:RNA polymerase sigma-70 factor (ECF subfamily)
MSKRLLARAASIVIDARHNIFPMGAHTRTSNTWMAADSEQLASLMTRLSSGDAAALGKLYDETVGRVYARVLRITGNPADADEVTCDVYREAWQKATQFDPTRGTPLQWLMIIARSRALDCSRRNRAQLEGLRGASGFYLSDAVPSTDEVLYQYEMVPQLMATLAQLSSVQARMVGLAFFDGLSHRDIAQAVQMPLGTVKSHLCRALLVLRKALTSVDEIDAPLSARQGSTRKTLPVAEHAVTDLDMFQKHEYTAPNA